MAFADEIAQMREGRPSGSSAAGESRQPVIGYASLPVPDLNRAELTRQAEAIATACDERRLTLLDLVVDQEPLQGRRARPALDYALKRIENGEARGLAIANASRVADAAAQLGSLIKRLDRSRARLIVAYPGIDTAEAAGRQAADVLVEVAEWERMRLSERTRKGLAAARATGKKTGRGSVGDYPEICQRIRRMRAEGMTLAGIAERLNQEGVPTIRGGTKWRHSSVQVAAGYRRRSRGAGSA